MAAFVLGVAPRRFLLGFLLAHVPMEGSGRRRGKLRTGRSTNRFAGMTAELAGRATDAGRLAIEVKAASRWTERDLAGLRAFLERTPRCRAAILAYNGEQAVRLGDKLWAVPLSTLLG